MKLFKEIFIATSVLLLTANNSFAQAKEEFQIKGSMIGLVEGRKVILRFWPTEEANGIDMDSSIVKNGEFSIRGMAPNGPRFYWLILPAPRGNRIIMLYLNNGDSVQINWRKNIGIGNISSKMAFFNDFISVEGSESYRDFYDLRSAYQLYFNFQSYSNQYLSEINNASYDKRLVEGFVKSKELMDRALLYGVILKSPFNKSTTWLMRDIRNQNHHSILLKQVYDSLIVQNKFDFKSYQDNWFKDLVRLSGGQPFPIVPFSDINGRGYDLSKIFAKSKITLVNFWSYNSYNIDRCQMELKEYYSKYNGKGLSIVGIYSDTSLKKWKIAAMDLPWDHISDLKGKEGVVASVYNEYGPPNQSIRNTTNVLIDSQGKIVAWDVNGVLLRFYLEKYLEMDY